MKNLVVNTKILSSHLTGVQRYLLSILNHWDLNEVDLVKPARGEAGFKGHLWEQFVLPRKADSRLIWSPSNSGPISHHNQVLTVHDLASIDLPQFHNWKFSAWYRFLVPQLVKNVAHIIAISNFTAGRLVEKFGVSEKRITVIWNGVDPRFQPCSEGEISAARAAAGIKDGRYIFALGSVEPRKNLGRLLSAWSKIQNSVDDDIQLVIAGAKGKSQVFSDAGLNLNSERVLFAGHVSDEHLPALYSGAMCAPYLSLYEGFGLPPLEAMACGAPVITSNCTAIPEVVGSAAVMVDPTNVDHISQALIEVLNSSSFRERFRKLGLAQADNFSWQKTADETRKVIKNFIR